MTSIEQLRYGNGSVQTLSPPPVSNPASGVEDVGAPQVWREMEVAKLDDVLPLVQPCSPDDEFLNLNLKGDSVGPQVQPGLFYDWNGLDGQAGEGLAHAVGGSGSTGGEGTVLAWGMEADILNAISEFEGRAHMAGLSAHDPWG